MNEPDPFEGVAEVCLTAHQVIEQFGTPEMQSTMKILLFQVGQELARRQSENRGSNLDVWQQVSESAS